MKLLREREISQALNKKRCLSQMILISNLTRIKDDELN